MFSSSHSDRFPDFDDDWFKEQREWSPPVMEIVVSLGVVVAVVVLVSLCCKCCCGSGNKGRVLQPPPDPALSVGVAVGPPVAYPQQQYNTVTVPTGMIVGNVSGYPPAHTSPYPAGAGAHYGGAPYPTHAPYPAGAMPQPASLPSAPDAHAVLEAGMGPGAGARRPLPPGAAPAAGWYPHPLPPTYEQVMSAEVKHSTPYNPYAPH